MTSEGIDAPRLPFAVRLRKLYETLRFPTSLAAAGVGAEVLREHRAEIVSRTLRSPAVLANPRVPSGREVEQLIDLAFGAGSAIR